MVLLNGSAKVRAGTAMSDSVVNGDDVNRPAEIEALGRRIQARRNQRGVTLDVMAVRTGFSKGYLSRIENGKKTPPLDTLASIARALGTDVNALLSEERAAAAESAPFFRVLRAGAHKREVRPESAFGYEYDRLIEGEPAMLMHPYLLQFPADFDPHAFFEHDGQEFVYVLRGRIEWQVGHERFVLDVGDSVYLDSRIPHRARALVPGASALLVVTPRKEPSKPGAFGLQCPVA